MKYERTTPLPPNEDKFESFYIRYSADDSKSALDVEVWETCEWSLEGRPIFFNAGPNAPGMDPEKIEPLFTLWTKWDGCSHMRLPYLHFDTLEEFDAFTRVVKYIWEDICDREGVVDGQALDLGRKS